LLRGLPKRLPENVRPALSTNPQDDLLFARDMKPADFAAGRLAVLGIHDPNRSVRVLVWGDSHAMAALPAFDTLLKAKGLAGRAATHSATAPVLGYESYGRFGRGKEAVRFNEAVLAYIQKQRIPHVVLVAQWLGYAADDESSPEGRSDGLSGHSSSLLQPALLDTVRKLVSVGSQPWIVLQVPSQPYDVSKLFHRWQKTLPELNYINQSGFCSKPDSSNGIVGDDPAFLDQLRGAGARLIDPRPCFLNGSQDLYQIVMNGVILYRDKTHLTKLGAETVLLPVLEKSFAPFLAVSANVR